MDQEKIQQHREQQAQQADANKQDANHQEVVGSLNNLLLATMVSKDPKMVEVAQNLGALLQKIGDASESFNGSSLHLLPFANTELANAVTSLADKVEQHSTNTDLQPFLAELNKQLSKISNVKPVVNIPTQAVSVDLKPLLDALNEVKSAVSKNKIDVPKTDLTSVTDGLKAVQKTINSLSFPASNYILPFKDSQGRATQVQLDSSGNVPITGGAGGGGTQYAELVTTAPATGTVALGRYKSSAPTLTDGQLYAPQLDASGNLKVNIQAGAGSGGTAMVDDAAFTVATTSFTPVGGTYKSTRDAVDDNDGGAFAMTPKRSIYATLETPNADSVMDETLDTVKISQATASNLNATVVGTGTFVTQSTLAAETTKVIGVVRNADGAGNLWTSNSTTYTAKFAQDANLLGTLGTAFSTAGKVDVKAADGDVFVRQATASNLNMTEASAASILTSVQLIDDPIATLGTTTYTEASTKGNIIGVVRRDADTTLVDTTNEVAPLQVNAAGQLKVANITALPAGSAVIGKVSIDQTTPGTTNLVALAANQSVNVTQFNGTTSVNGSGTATGALRVELPTNGTGVIATVGAVTAITNALPAGTNAIGKLAVNSGVIIGAVEIAAAQTLATVTTVGTVSAITAVGTITPGTAASSLGKAEDAAHASGDTGVLALSVANEALTNISGTDGDYTIIGSDRNGTIHVAQKASTATLSNVAASATSVTLLSANAARIGAQITNDSSVVVYIKFGTTASTTSYTVSLAGAASAPFSYYEVPAGYTGRIDAIWASATGNARITEITP